MCNSLDKADIVLIEPTKYTWEELGLFGRHSRLEPIGIEYIAAVCKEEGYSVKIIQQHKESISEICNQCLDVHPRWIGISTLTHTWDVTKEIARAVKKRCSSIKIIVGGYHPTMVPFLCLKSEYIDFVVIGEGEYTFLELIRTLDEDKEINNVNGIAYKKDNSIKVTEPRRRIKQLNELPYPIRDKSLLKNCFVGGYVYPPPNKQISTAQIIYSRGCPYECTYCCSSVFWKRTVTYRTSSNVINEIKFLKKNFGTNFLFFDDLIFPINRIKAIQLCEKINKSKIDINWFCFSRIDSVDRELLVKMKHAGCSKIGFGIESFSSKTRNSFKRNLNYNSKEFLQLVRNVLELVWSLGITTRLYLIFGHPEETYEDILITKDIIKELYIDELRIGLLTPFPGLEIFNDFKKKNLLLTEDWRRYTTEEDIIRRDKISYPKLEELRDKILKDFYQSDNYRKRAEEKIHKYPHLKQSYEWFSNFLQSKDIRV